MHDSSSPTFFPPGFDNIAMLSVMPQSAADLAASWSDDARSGPKSHFSTPATAFPAASPALPASAVHRDAASKGAGSERVALYKDRDS